MSPRWRTRKCPWMWGDVGCLRVARTVWKHRIMASCEPPLTRRSPGQVGGRAPGRLRVVAGIAVGCLLLASCGASQPRATPATPTTSSTPKSQPNTPTSAPDTATAGAGGLATPAVPATGAYLGAWLHPVAVTGGGSSFAAQVAALPAVLAATGRPLRLLHVYVRWSAPPPIAALSAIAAQGSIPILDWGCAPDGSAVAGGSDDALISTFASALVSYRGPVLLRWCWEMNLVRSHPQVGGASGFVSAWGHIHTLFTNAGAANVSFVWCPALTGVDPAPFFPGSASVDWIAVDGYDRDGTQTFSSLFSGFYRQWETQGKPMMVAETGSAGSAQAGFIESIGTDAPSLPQFKAVVYFDAQGPLADWRFTPAGLQAYAALARNPYFAP